MKCNLRVVPFWLSQAILSAGGNLNMVTDIPKLNDILSIDDISFYLALNMSLQHHVPKSFLDSFEPMNIDLGGDVELQKHIDDELVLNKGFKDLMDFINAQYDDGAEMGKNGKVLLGFEVIKIIENTVLLRFIARESNDELVEDYKNLLAEIAKISSTAEVASLPLFNAYEATLNKQAFDKLVGT